MWKCVCDICGKAMIPIDAHECKISFKDKSKRFIHALVVTIDTGRYVETPIPLFEGQVCNDCANKLESRLRETIKKMQSDATILKS